MTETKLMKLVVRKFLLDKMRETTNLELADLAAKYGLSSFHVAECFDYEAFRVEKFFCFPQDELQESNDSDFWRLTVAKHLSLEGND